jgi:hypothetical protein
MTQVDIQLSESPFPPVTSAYFLTSINQVSDSFQEKDAAQCITLFSTFPERKAIITHGCWLTAPSPVIFWEHFRGHDRD